MIDELRSEWKVLSDKQSIIEKRMKNKDEALFDLYLNLHHKSSDAVIGRVAEGFTSELLELLPLKKKMIDIQKKIIDEING